MIFAVLLPFLRPYGEPVSSGAANGSKLALVQSSSIVEKVVRISSVGKFSSRSMPASFIVPLYEPAYRSTDW